MTSSTIDPAAGLRGEFARHTVGTTARISQMRKSAIYTNGAVPARLKMLAALLWSVGARCEPCVKFYAKEAMLAGASDAEVGEMLAIANAMGGCVGETWAMKAFAAAKAVDGAADACCP